ncbi:hypothetical protein KAX06_05735 [candidate division WOR-3 bacterium]|nr:hypothetical protein [candidate division WOR-3 bacterium]
MPKGQAPILVKVSVIASVVLLIGATGAAAFIAGYSLAFSKVADVYAQTSVLKAKAAELEAEVLHLKNYAVLIDAIATSGKAANELLTLPQFDREPETEESETLHEGEESP